MNLCLRAAATAAWVAAKRVEVPAAVVVHFAPFVAVAIGAMALPAVVGARKAAGFACGWLLLLAWAGLVFMKALTLCLACV